jgi:hypothetical protein
MPRKRTSGNELAVSAGAAAAVTARRKPASATRKKSVVAQAEPSAALSAPRRAKASAAKPPAHVPNTPTAEQIANLAYHIWEARGCQGGSPEEDWLAAERQLLARPR